MAYIFSIIILTLIELFFFRSAFLFILFFSFFGAQSHALYKVENVLKLLRQSTRSHRFIILSKWNKSEIRLFILYTEKLFVVNSELTGNTL